MMQDSLGDNGILHLIKFLPSFGNKDVIKDDRNECGFSSYYGLLFNGLRRVTKKQMELHDNTDKHYFDDNHDNIVLGLSYMGTEYVFRFVPGFIEIERGGRGETTRDDEFMVSSIRIRDKSKMAPSK